MNSPIASRIVPEAIWIDLNSSFNPLAQPFLRCLAKENTIAHWSYEQTPDEPGSLDVAITMLHGFLKSLDRPVHLVGHSLGGLTGLLYAQRFSHRVKSLTLLAVGVNPVLDWQAFYYAQLRKLECDRDAVLRSIVHALLGPQTHAAATQWIEVLEQDLVQSLSPHTLLKHVSMYPGEIPVPLLVCGARQDPVVHADLLFGWQPVLKPGDRVWQCPQGRHFFHADYPRTVSEQVLNFWTRTDAIAADLEVVRQAIPQLP